MKQEAKFIQLLENTRAGSVGNIFMVTRTDDVGIWFETGEKEWFIPYHGERDGVFQFTSRPTYDEKEELAILRNAIYMLMQPEYEEILVHQVRTYLGNLGLWIDPAND